MAGATPGDDGASSSSHRGQGPTSSGEERPPAEPEAGARAAGSLDPAVPASDPARAAAPDPRGGQPHGDRVGEKRKRSITRSYAQIGGSMPQEAQEVFQMMQNDDMPTLGGLAHSWKFKIVYTIEDAVLNASDSD